MMRSFLFSALLLFPSYSFASRCPVPADPSFHASARLSRVPAHEAARVLLNDFFLEPYVVSEDAESLSKPVSLSVDGSLSDVRRQLSVYFLALGYSFSVRDCIGYLDIYRAPEKKEYKEPTTTAVYHPRYRTSSVLSSSLRGVFNDLKLSSSSSGFGSSGSGGSGVSSGMGGDSDVPVLVLMGPVRSVRSALSILPSLDIPEQSVVISVRIFQVSASRTDQSALQLALNLLKTTVSASSTGSYGLGNSFSGMVTLQSNLADQLIASLSSDSRFQLVGSDELRAVSGSSASFNSGQQTPTLGSVSYTGGSSSAVQSVTYRDSGVSLAVTPVVHLNSIHVRIEQSNSSFAATTTGVNNSPTLNQEKLVSDAVVQDGGVVFLGAMSSAQRTKGNIGFFGLMGGAQGNASASDLVIIAKVSLVPQEAPILPRDADAASLDRSAPKWSPDRVRRLPSTPPR